MENNKNEWVEQTRSIEIRAVENGFEGIACKYNVIDSYGTVFIPGCFTRGGLEVGAKYSLLWQHNPSQPVGTFTAEEREDGLYIVGKWDNNSAGKDAREAAISGSASDLSVGFTWLKSEGSSDDIIEVARLMEVSQITTRFGAVPGSVLTAVRAALEEAGINRWSTTYHNDESVMDNHGEQGSPEAEEEETLSETVEETEEERALPGELVEGDLVSFISEDGIEYGRVEYIMTEGEFGVTGDPLSTVATEDNPFALIRLYTKEDDMYEPTNTFVGKLFSELTKIEVSEVAEETSTEEPMEESESNTDRINNITILSRYIDSL